MFGDGTFLELGASETHLIVVGSAFDGDSEFERQRGLQHCKMIVKVKGQVVVALYAEAVAVDVECEREELKHIVLHNELDIHVFDPVGCLVLEKQPFAECAVGIGIDNAQAVAAKSYGRVESGQNKVHLGVDVDCGGYVGIDDAAEVAHYRNDGVDSRHQREEALELQLFYL